MSDLAPVLQAIEASNRAFEEFKRTNDERIAKVEKGNFAEADFQAKMNKAFDDMAAQKSLIETLEAKLKRPGMGGSEGQGDDKAVEAEHKKGFDRYFRKGIDAGLADLETKALALTTNSGADGGYAVPKVIDALMESLVVNISPIRQLANVIQISTSDYHKLVNLKGAASAVAGETAARAATNTPTLADVIIKPWEMYGNPQATQQMLDDVYFNAEQWLADELAEEFGRQEGALFISGNGTSQPQGLLTPTMAATADNVRAFGTVQYVPTGVAGGFPATNPADIFFTMVAAVKARYRNDASFIMPKSVLFTAATFKDSSGRYIFNPISGPGVPASILGFPVVEAEDMPAVAASSLSIAFGNFKRAYQIVDRIGTRIIRDPFSNKPYIGFYTTKRVGGGVVNSEAYKTLKFSVT